MQSTPLASDIKKRSYLRLLIYFFLIGFVLPALTSCESRKTIVNELDEREANEILVFLSTKNIDALKQKGEASGGGGKQIVTWVITVPQDQANEAMALLNQAGLPRRRTQSLLGIFSNAGLVPSEMEQKIKYQQGLGEQIGSIIRKIDGVLDSEVQISFPPEDPLNPDQPKGKITASVYVKHNGVLDDPNSHLITKIKRLVAASVTGLDYDNVTVIPDLARNAEILPGISTSSEEKPLVNVWTLILAKESVTRFRIIFFSFFLLSLILVLLLVWISWKIYPLLQQHGGFKELLHLHPIISKPEEEVKADKEKKEEEVKQEDKGQVDKDVDET